MNRIYGVWKQSDIDAGYFSNDEMEWYESSSEAFNAWKKASETLVDGDSVYFGEFDNDDCIDESVHELKNHNGNISEYSWDGTLLWL